MAEYFACKDETAKILIPENNAWIYAVWDRDKRWAIPYYRKLMTLHEIKVLEINANSI